MLEVVTIDGPSGSGKSSTSKMLARKLNYSYLDTGAMYRAFAVCVLEKGLERNRDSHKALLDGFSVSFSVDGLEQKVLCNGTDVTEIIRRPDVSMWSSTLSKEAEVRERMGMLQREIGEKGRVVAEGRDMGTVVFTDAFAKFFLRAGDRMRAERRWLELKAKNSGIAFDEVFEDLKKRDIQDSERELAPLRPADDAVIIDNSEMGIDAVVDRMLAVIEEKKKQWK